MTHFFDMLRIKFMAGGLALVDAETAIVTLKGLMVERPISNFEVTQWGETVRPINPFDIHDCPYLVLRGKHKADKGRKVVICIFWDSRETLPT